jgi:hypothetical protein
MFPISRAGVYRSTVLKSTRCYMQFRGDTVPDQQWMAVMSLCVQQRLLKVLQNSSYGHFKLVPVRVTHILWGFMLNLCITEIMKRCSSVLNVDFFRKKRLIYKAGVCCLHRCVSA